MSPHALPDNPTITQQYMQETPYHFQIPAFDYTKDQFYSSGTKVTNPFDFWFEINFNFMHLQFNFNKPNKPDFFKCL